MQHHHQTSNTQVYRQYYTFKSFHLIKVTWKLSGCFWIMYTGALSHHQDFIVVSRRACSHCACSPLRPAPTLLNEAESFHSSCLLFPRHDLLSTSVVSTVLGTEWWMKWTKVPALGKLTILKSRQEVLWQKPEDWLALPRVTNAFLLLWQISTNFTARLTKIWRQIMTFLHLC